MAHATPHICGGDFTSGDCSACIAEDRAIQETATRLGVSIEVARDVFYGWEPTPDESLPKKKPIPHWLAKQVMERDAYRCQWPRCGTWIDLTIDHVIPESLGGQTVLENLQTMCRPHNSSKGARL